MSKRRRPNPEDLAVQQLLKEGYVVLQVPGVEISAESWDSVIKLMPEFKPNAKIYVGGGGALANASSFHNSLVRRLRISVFESAREIFIKLADELGFDRMELLIDQMLQRMPGQRTLEEWHQELAKSPNLEQGDVVLNGWLNIDSFPQVFNCCPGSHSLEQSFRLIGTNQREFWRARVQRITVPPKHVVVFFHNLVYGSTTTIARQRRLNMGWRLTNSTLPFVPDIRQRLAAQSIVPLWNGRMPVMWPAIYWTNYREKLAQLSDNFQPIMQMNTINKSMGSVDHVFRYCPSLTTLGLSLYSKYTEEEIEYYKPFLI